MKDTGSLGPLTLEPLLVERIWGEEKIHDWYPQPAPGTRIGEVWLTAEECRVEGTSETLRATASRASVALGNERREGFPLLIKLLYPHEKLSVQVHPNDEQAAERLHEPRGKTECWYVLSAEPGAQIALGFMQDLNAAEMRNAIDDGTIESKLRRITVKAGDMFLVDAGTVHAIGPGMVVLETQQYSDTTFRLWDYGRPRELHLDAGLAVARSRTAADLVAPQQMEGFQRLIACPYFTVDSFKSSAGVEEPLRKSTGMQILVALGSAASVIADGEVYPLRAGSAVLLPDEGRQYDLRAPAGIEVIRIFVSSQ